MPGPDPLTRDRAILRWAAPIDGARLDHALADGPGGHPDLDARAAGGRHCARDTRPALAPRTVLVPAQIAGIPTEEPRWLDLCTECALELDEQLHSIEHPCANARCADRDIDKQIPALAGYCTDCFTLLEHAISGAAGRWQELRAEQARDGGADGEKVSGTKDAPVPVRLELWYAMDRLVAAVLGAEDWLRAHGGAPAAVRADVDSWSRVVPRSQRLVLAAAITYVVRTIRVLVAEPGGCVLAQELLAADWACMAALGKTPYVTHLEAPCPSCGYRAMVRRNGTEDVVCEVCGRRTDPDGYDWLSRVLAKEWADDPRPERLMRLHAGQAEQARRVRAFGTAHTVDGDDARGATA